MDRIDRNIDERLKRLREAIKSVQKPSAEEPDVYTKKEIGDYERKKKQIIIEGLKQDIEERKKYASLIFKLICYWLCGIFVLILLQGLCSIHRYNFLSDKVLITIIGGTTINILGLFVIVVKYLFKERKF